MERTPNLLFIYTDEQRFDTLAAYGNDQIDMPNLNRLAEQSCVFDRAYVTQPVCTPSRSSLLTGLYPHSNGCAANNLPLDESIPCLPEMLPADKYATAHIGKWHLGDELFAQHGFEHWISIEDGYNRFFRPGRDREKLSDYCQWLKARGYTPDNGRAFGRSEAAAFPEEVSKPAFLAEHSSSFIREHQDEPFCLYVNFLEPHMPFSGPRDEQYDPAEVPLPANFESPPNEDNHLRSRLLHDSYRSGAKFCYSDDPDSVQSLIARYWGLCSQVDTHCGTILQTLEECGLWDDTIIVFTSDHGDMMGSHQLVAKCVMYEESTRVPMLVKMPGQKQLHHINGPVSQIDLVPTLLELMGVEPPAHLQGRSQVKAMQDNSKADADNEDVVIEWNGPNTGFGGDDPQEVEIQDNWLKLADRERVIDAFTDPLRTAVSRDGRWKLNLSPILDEHELFDLENDPHERHNIYGRPDTQAVTEQLTESIRRWQRRTRDEAEIC